MLRKLNKMIRTYSTSHIGSIHVNGLGADTHMYTHITEKNLKKQSHAEEQHMHGLKIWEQETSV